MKNSLRQATDAVMFPRAIAGPRASAYGNLPQAATMMPMMFSVKASENSWRFHISIYSSSCIVTQDIPFGTGCTKP